MQNRKLSLLLTGAVFLSSGCIHTKDYERTSIQLSEMKDLKEMEATDAQLRIEHLVFSPVKLPLENFFGRLMAGEFKEAFARIDFAYEAATSDDKVLQKLLDEGFIPVYVRMRNKGQRVLNVRETDFFLSDGRQQLQAIPSQELPRVFESFNLGALGANVYNTGVVVVAVATYMAALILTTGGHIGPFNSISRGNLESSEVSTKIYNETTKKTHVDYNNYLLTSGLLTSEVKGLLFFRVNESFDRGSMRFGYKNQSQAVSSSFDPAGAVCGL